jgi:hypothetical protein
MEGRALAMGFQPIQRDQTLFLVVPGYVQPDHVTLAPPPAPVTVVAAALPPDFTQSLIDWLRQRVSLPSLSLLEVDR